MATAIGWRLDEIESSLLVFLLLDDEDDDMVGQSQHCNSCGTDSVLEALFASRVFRSENVVASTQWCDEGQEFLQRAEWLHSERCQGSSTCPLQREQAMTKITRYQELLSLPESARSSAHVLCDFPLVFIACHAPWAPSTHAPQQPSTREPVVRLYP